MLDLALPPDDLKDTAPPPVRAVPARNVRSHEALRSVLAQHPVLLAPMEDISDIAFRALCRAQGADLTYTEFVNVEGLLHNCRIAARKIALAPGEWPVGIQIYGANPATLVEAARVAEERGPTLIDINCGCWVPRIAARGAGSGWLRNLPAMEEMVRAVVRAVSVPVTVKTRIGWGDGEPPVREIVRRLEDAGAAAITLHCRTALQRHEGAADWSWAARAQETVRVPVILNGGVGSAADAVAAFRQTGCAGVMVARAAIGNPWIFAEARAALAAAGVRPSPIDRERDDGRAPSVERLAVCKQHYQLGAELRGERVGVCATRRHLMGYLRGVPDGAALRDRLNHEPTLAGCVALLDAHAAALRGHEDRGEVA